MRSALRAWNPNCRKKASWVTSRPSSPYRNCTTVLCSQEKLMNSSRGQMTGSW